MNAHMTICQSCGKLVYLAPAVCQLCGHQLGETTYVTAPKPQIGEVVFNLPDSIKYRLHLYSSQSCETGIVFLP